MFIHLVILLETMSRKESRVLWIREANKKNLFHCIAGAHRGGNFLNRLKGDGLWL